MTTKGSTDLNAAARHAERLAWSRAKRDENIRSAYDKGVPVIEIAERTGLTRQGVYGILNLARP